MSVAQLVGLCLIILAVIALLLVMLITLLVISDIRRNRKL